MKWDLDREAMAQVCEHLGVTYRVHVNFTTFLKYPVMGTYCGVGAYEPRLHLVDLSPSDTACAVHANLVHELVHAAQCERMGGYVAFLEEYERQMAELGITRRDPDWAFTYRHLPLEVEAYQWQAEAHELPRLVVARGGPLNVPIQTEHLTLSEALAKVGA